MRDYCIYEDFYSLQETKAPEKKVLMTLFTQVKAIQDDQRNQVSLWYFSSTSFL